MATAFLKFFTRDRSALTGGLAHHNAGTRRPKDYTHPRPELPAVVDLLAGTPAGDSAQRTQAATTFLETARRHHKARPCVELLVAGPPRYEPDPTWETHSPEYLAWHADRQYWTTQRIHAWAQDHVAFLEKMLPSARLFSAHLHQDETSPHCHLTFVPADGSNYVSWRPLSAGAVGEKPPKDKNDRVQAARIMSKWQDRYHQEVADQYRLERGEKGSTRRHEPLTDKKRRRALSDRMAGEVLEAERKLAAERAERIAVLEHESRLLRRALVDVARFAENVVRQAVPATLRDSAAAIWKTTTAPAREALTASKLSWPLSGIDAVMALAHPDNTADAEDRARAADAAEEARAAVREELAADRKDENERRVMAAYSLGIQAERAAAEDGLAAPADPLAAEEWLKSRAVALAGGAEPPAPSA